MDYLVGILSGLSAPLAYLLVFFILLACGLGLPIPEDITLFAGGVLAYIKLVNVWWMITISMIGVLLGDSIIYFLGAKYGLQLTKKTFFKKVLTEERLAIVREKLKKQGNKVIFAARFMPGLRAPVYFSSGTLHLPFRVFIFYDGLAAAISVPAIIYSVYYFGDMLEEVLGVIRRVQNGIIITIIIIILLVLLKWYIRVRKKKNNES